MQFDANGSALNKVMASNFQLNMVLSYILKFIIIPYKLTEFMQINAYQHSLPHEIYSVSICMSDNENVGI